MKNLIYLCATFIMIISCNNPQKNQTKTADEPQKSESQTNKITVLDDNDSSSANTNAQLQGIDVSSYQTGIDWKKVKDDGISFVFVKATGGETYEDPAFTTHWKDVNQANLARGSYHFYYTKDDPTTQANFFISKVLPLSEDSDLPPVLDIETAGVNTDITVDQLQADIKTFLSVVENSFKKKPILYTSHSFAQKYFNNPEFGQYYLWLAEYDTETPLVPNGWKESGWTFWQNSATATVNGIEGEVDHDIFNGSMQKLQSLQ